MIPGPNWTRRYGSATRRLCARAGCGAPASATLRFQPTRREAWLVDLEVDVARTEGDLCTRHASALVLPRGWDLHDQRDPGHVPVVAEPATAAPRTRRTRRARPRREPAPMVPGLVATPADVPEQEAAPPEVTADNPGRSPSTELASLLDASTPLLKRAFGNVDIDLDRDRDRDRDRDQ